MQASITLREASDADRPSVISLVSGAYRQYTEQLGEDWWEGYSQNLGATLSAGGSPGTLIVAGHDDALAGSVLYFPPGTTSFGHPSLRLLAVAPDQRGQGIATRLLEECLTRAKAAGAAALVLHTNQVMAVPRRMYEKRGFVRAPEYDFSPLPNDHVLGFRIDLNRD